MTKTSSRRLREVIVVLGVSAIGAAAALGAATPASAVPSGYYILASAEFADGGFRAPAANVLVELIDDSTAQVVDQMVTAEEGRWGFFGVAPDLYDVRFTSQNDYFPANVAVLQNLVVASDTNLTAFPITSFPALDGGDISISGSPIVGETVSATVSPFLDANGAPVSGVTWKDPLHWAYSKDGGTTRIGGATGASLVVPSEAVTSMLVYSGYAEKSGYRPTPVAGASRAVSAPQAAAAPAPVADSSQLAAFFASRSLVPWPASAAGLSEQINPASARTATIAWRHPDSFVDVYAYSSARFLGTYPVNGAVELQLSSATLSALGAGPHTLLIIGQSSSRLTAVEFSISPALAATGSSATVPLGVAGGLVVLGGALLVWRRIRFRIGG